MTWTSRDVLLLKGLCNGLWTIPSGADYSRLTEWPLAANMLDVQDGMRVLDAGAGGQSMFPLLIAWKHDVSVFAMDWADSMHRLRHWYSTCKRSQRIRGRVHFSRGDVCRLPFDAGSFDRVSCVSTIEHLPAEGDFEAAREMARVLRPGGRLVVTVPFVAHGRNEFKRDHVYERHAPGKLVFFQRLYDFATLTERIVRPSGLSLHTARFLVEPARRYFWEQDCARTEEAGATVLKDRGMTYGERCLRYLRARRYTHVVDEHAARMMPEALFAACVTLVRP